MNTRFHYQTPNTSIYLAQPQTSMAGHASIRFGEDLPYKLFLPFGLWPAGNVAPCESITDNFKLMCQNGLPLTDPAQMAFWERALHGLGTAWGWLGDGVSTALSPFKFAWDHSIGFVWQHTSDLSALLAVGGLGLLGLLAAFQNPAFQRRNTVVEETVGDLQNRLDQKAAEREKSL